MTNLIVLLCDCSAQIKPVTNQRTGPVAACISYGVNQGRRGPAYPTEVGAAVGRPWHDKDT